ncbi:MAG: Crp/Fnr family transcriptional regulator [Clostridia bacterium]|nr:Crp/Fnr family transcriptional regulator [Clostridia bacterium]
MVEQYINALIKCELFHGIEREQLSSLLSCLKPQLQSYSRQDFVVKPGDSLESLGIVLKGEASVLKESLSGNRILLKNLEPGEMFGEIAAFAGQEEWPALVQANGPLTVCFISKNKVAGQCGNVCSFHAAMTTNMLRIVSERALLLSKKLDYVSIRTMRAKLSTFIFEHYKRTGKQTFMLPMNRTQLADFLYVSRPSMSRELSRMRDEGIIDFHLSTIKVLDAVKLQTYCE